MSVEDAYSPDAEPSRSPSERSDGAVETREQKLARIRAEIAAGTYDTDEKLEKALDRMIDSLETGL